MLSKLLLAVLICMIGVIRFGTTSVHAMTQQDLAGEVYRVVATMDGDNGESEDFSSPYYVFINNKGKVVKVDDPDEQTILIPITKQMLRLHVNKLRH